MEIRLSKLAAEKISEVVKANEEVAALRIYVAKAGCSGAVFGLAFDDAKETDDVTVVDGISFITDTEYIPQYSDGLDIDFNEGENEGFIIKSINPVQKSCGSCSCGS
ncbi:MAG: iron-sulfur cluster assembly accessory protein [Clostridium sp.]